MQGARHRLRGGGARVPGLCAILANVPATTRIRYRVTFETDIGRRRKMGTTAADIVHSKLTLVKNSLNIYK